MSALAKKALEFARAAHQGQLRKYNGQPYISHPLDVAGILMQRVSNVSEEMVAAALLHDVLEDTDTDSADIYLGFGDEVGNLVTDLTKPISSQNRRGRAKQEVERLSKISPEAQTIKCADILSNLRDIRQADPDFAPLYIREKRDQLMAMDDAHVAIRQAAWLATFPKKGVIQC